MVVAESAALRDTGARGEMGLYAWKDFKRDAIIGRYTGEEIREEEEGKRLRAGVDKLNPSKFYKI